MAEPLTMTILHSKQLTLRPCTLADRADFIALERDPEVMRFLNGGYAVDQNESDPRAPFLMPRGTEPYVWTARRTAIDTFVGWFCLWPETECIAELGYRLARKAWGQGLASEGASAHQLGVQNARLRQNFRQHHDHKPPLAPRYGKDRYDLCPHNPPRLAKPLCGQRGRRGRVRVAAPAKARRITSLLGLLLCTILEICTGGCPRCSKNGGKNFYSRSTSRHFFKINRSKPQCC